MASQKGQSVSLSRDIAILTTQIKKSKLDIQAKGLVIKKLGGEIQQKNKKIETLTTKIETEKESLAQLIRKEDALEYHAKGRPGKIEVIPTKETKTQRDAAINGLQLVPVGTLATKQNLFVTTAAAVSGFLEGLAGYIFK